MVDRSISDSLRRRGILKLTFLFLANFVQARRLPTQVESAIRACTQCRKSPCRGDFPSFDKWIALRAHCTTRCGLRIAHRVFCAPSLASRKTGFAACQPSRVTRRTTNARLSPVVWSALSVTCIPSAEHRQAHPDIWRVCGASRRMLKAPRQTSHGHRTTPPAACQTRVASRLLLDPSASCV